MLFWRWIGMQVVATVLLASPRLFAASDDDFEVVGDHDETFAVIDTYGDEISEDELSRPTLVQRLNQILHGDDFETDLGGVGETPERAATRDEVQRETQVAPARAVMPVSENGLPDHEEAADPPSPPTETQVARAQTEATAPVTVLPPVPNVLAQDELHPDQQTVVATGPINDLALLTARNRQEVWLSDISALRLALSFSAYLVLHSVQRMCP